MVEKLDLSSPDITDENILWVADRFPNVITEGRDGDGKLTRVVDFDALRQELSDSVVEGPQERYRLDWPGKRAAMLAANTPISKTLRPVRGESVDFDTTKNLFIEGDNLDALKLLQETYLGKVKMIYIDPPYNTGKDFIYKDNFTADKQEYLEDSGQIDEEGGRLVANPESNGRYHSDWLSMMYPRLKLARNLLRDDGVIFISINDVEVMNLKRVLDEVFGEKQFVANLIWKRKNTPPNDQVLGTQHEYIICYGKSAEHTALFLRPRSKDQINKYKNPDGHPKGPWVSGDLSANVKGGRYSAALEYSITNPRTGKTHWPTKGGNWRFGKSKVQDLLDTDQIYFGKSDEGKPKLKRFLCDVKDGVSWSTIWDFVPFNTSGTKEIQRLFGVSAFENPKPIGLLEAMLTASTQDGDLVLDFFAGSGTMSEAVMNRAISELVETHFILVQLQEPWSLPGGNESLDFNTITDLSKERVRRAGAKILEENPAQVGKLDVGFRVLKIDSSNMNDVYASPQSLDQNDLLSRVEHIKPDRSAEDLLFQVMLSQGVDLSLPIVQETLAGKTVFFIDGDALAACFDTKVSEEVVKAMAERRPLYAIFRDDGFASDDMKINAGQLFKQMTEEHTRMKVI